MEQLITAIENKTVLEEQKLLVYNHELTTNEPLQDEEVILLLKVAIAKNRINLFRWLLQVYLVNKENYFECLDKAIDKANEKDDYLLRKKLVLHRVGRQVKNQHDHENKLQMELEQINDSWKRVEFEELFLHKITTEEIKQHVKALEFKYKSVIPYYYVTQFLDYFYLKRRNDKILYWMISRHAHEETTLFNWLLLKPRNDVEFFAKAKAILRDYKQAIAALKSQFIFVLGEIEAAPPQLNKVLYNGARLFNEGQKRFKSGGFEPVTLEKESTNCVVVS